MIQLLEGLYEEGSGGGTPTPATKYGVDVDAFLGNKSSDGMLQIPTAQASVDFTGIKSIGSQALMNKFLNMNVVSVNFSDLESLNAASACEGAFYSCTLEKVEFPKLTSVNGSKALKLAFGKNLHLTEIKFNVLSDLGTRTDQFDDMLEGVTGCTVHFPAALESTIENWTSVTNGFGGTNTIVVYDL